MQVRLLGSTLACVLGLTTAALAQSTPPAAPAAAPPAAAAAPAPTARIRGTITKVTQHDLVVHARDGSTVDITLTQPLTVVTVKRVPLSAIKDDTYVGIASRNGPNGTAQALEVLVFPPAMRGVAAGHYAWDLEPGSMMTNAPVTGVAKAASGRNLTLTYKDGTIVVHVPPATPIVTFAPATAADLKAGRKVFVIAHKDADGHWAAPRVTVGTHGVNPPM